MSKEKLGEWPLTHEEVEAWSQQQNWHFAKTRPENPHHYCLRRECDDKKMFDLVVLHIREFGFKTRWWGSPYTMYDADGHRMWSMGNPLEVTKLINRKTDEQVRKDDAIGKAGWSR